MLWTLLNDRFNEENEYVMDYAICEVYDEYAVVFKFETGEYNRVYYTKNDETDSLAIDKMEVCYIVDVNENEKHALETLHAMNNNTYEKLDEVVSDLNTKVEEFTTQVEEFNSKIEENNTTIATLQQDNEKLQNELEEVNSNYTASLETIETLTSENTELNSFKADVELKEKEAVIAKYSALLDEEDLDGFKDRLNEFTKEDLDKELAYALVQSKSTIFTNAEDNFIPKPEENLTGIEAILARQKNKKK
jgi:vacuolar-type H+-ATPase subunit I/STV1